MQVEKALSLGVENSTLDVGARTAVVTGQVPITPLRAGCTDSAASWDYRTQKPLQRWQQPRHWLCFVFNGENWPKSGVPATSGQSSFP